MEGNMSTITLNDLARLLSPKEAACFLGVSKSWLDKKRLDGAGPIYLKLGRRVVYDPTDLNKFVTQAKRRNTSDGGANV
jgi:predicted DNA-binding transcriptional regulator AlpA